LEVTPLCVIIVTYNNKDEIGACLTSVKNCSAAKHKLIVVDNASDDGTGSWVRENHADVFVQENRENLGFGPAINKAVNDHACPACDIFLLNPDAIVTRGWDTELARTACSSQHIGVVQSKLILMEPETPAVIQSIGNEIHFAGYGYCGGLNQLDSKAFQVDREISYACGAAMFIRREVLHAVGLFDDSMFLYHEDFDLCARVRLAGYRVVLSAKSIVRHSYHFHKGNWKYFHVERNRLISILKTYELKTIAVLFPALLLVEIAVTCHSASSGWLLQRFRVYVDLVTLFPVWRRSRLSVQAGRKISDREFLGTCTSVILVPGRDSSIGLRVLNCALAWYWSLTRRVLGIRIAECATKSRDSRFEGGAVEK
jgi:GT2 family glycosyltransferase